MEEGILILPLVFTPEDGWVTNCRLATLSPGQHFKQHRGRARLQRRTFETLENEVQSGLKQAMRSYPQGVTVVTVMAEDGPVGLTVSSFTSVSLDPPLVLISIAKSSGLYALFRDAGAFAVNFLADDQKTVSDRFAGRTGEKHRFDGIRFTKGMTGSPVISGSRAVLECKAWQRFEGGDHSILVGEVVVAKTLNSKKPLVYYSQQYTTTESMEYPAPPSDIVW
jgi:flavin reductase (DIM6/NTAB) family NADH-FMN oxidoreductase RutF